MELKKMNSKGMFFTLFVIAILLLFLLTYGTSSAIKSRMPIEKRIETMDTFVYTIEKDIPRMLYISGFRSLLILQKKVVETGNYISDADSKLKELFYNGTYNNNPQELMIGANFSEIQEFLSMQASKINAEVILSNPNLEVYQSDPFNIKYSLSVNLLVKDKSNLSLWNKTQTFVTFIPLLHFEDPVYIVETSNLVTNKIIQSPYLPFVNGNDVSNLSAHLLGSYYINSSLAPSFLLRLEGNFSANRNGIESLVYLPELSSQGIVVKDKCIVDYVYFSNQNPNPLYRLNVTEPYKSWFKIDNAHRSIYGIENISYVI